MNKYYYAGAEVLAQPTGGNMLYYIHDRLGSLRLTIMGTTSSESYNYTPFGEDMNSVGTDYNPFKFTGQWYDHEIGQYYLRARMYDPKLGRFTDRDPIVGKFQRPLTLHKYLYCENDPTNYADPTGRSAWNLVGEVIAGSAAYSATTYTIATAIQHNNDWLLDLGLKMQYLIPPAMAFGAITGPLLPYAPGALAEGSLALWEGVVGSAGYVGGAIGAGAKALTYWAMANPYEFISVVDVLGQIGGPPDALPTTPAGWVTWFYIQTRDNE